MELVITGGGASGILLLIQLLQNPDFNQAVTVVNTRYPLAKGIAYSSKSREHLLNVRAGRMSVFPDKPNDFTEWITNQPAYEEYQGEELAEQFLPRFVFGEYILQRLNDLLNSSVKKSRIKLINDEVTDLSKEGSYFLVTLASGKQIQAGNVVLATGNTPASSLPGLDLPSDKRIILNPWEENLMSDLNPEQDIMVLGSGLTMADTIISLGKANFKGKIHVLSRHGHFPVSHPETTPKSPDDKSFEPSNNLHTLYRQIKDRIRAEHKNIHWHESVLAAIRPHTQKIWQQFSEDEKARFLRHLNHRWAILRHRIPEKIGAQLACLQSQGKLIMYAGKVLEIRNDTPLLQVKIHRKPGSAEQIVSVQRLFNCTGPEMNPEKIQWPLIKNLLQKGVIRADNLKLGYDALPDGRLIDKNGVVNNNLWSLGPGLRGILWESTAIPEIRVQAANLAQKLSRIS